MSAAQVFNPRVAIGLIAAGIAGFVALMLLAAYGGGAAPRGDGRAHALSGSAVGFKGLVRLVGEFHDTRLIRSDFDFDTDNLVVVALEEQSRPEDLRRILDQRRGRATLIILPKWATVADPARRGWVRSIGPFLGPAAEPAIDGDIDVRMPGESDRPARVAEGEDILSGLGVPVPRLAQSVAGKSLVPLVPLPGVEGAALVARIGDQPHYILADPDLMNNQGLDDPATARAALALVELLNSTDADAVEFDLTLNGLGSASASGASLLRLAFEPPFLVMTLALFAAALLAGLHGAARFGPVRREPRAIAFGKTALVENSAGLIRLAEREASLGAAYADVVRHEAARATAAPYWLQGEELDLYLDRLRRAQPRSFSELAADLCHARDRHSLLAAARALFQWKKDIVR